jgi:hypothetical protein
MSTATKPAVPSEPSVAGEPTPGELSRSRPGLRGLLALPGEAFRKVVRSSATSPGRLTLIATGLIVLSLLVGLTAAVMVRQKSDVVADLTDRKEPLAAAAQQVYRALSDADATAASSFLATGEEPPALRERFENDIAQAGVYLARTASDTAAGPEFARHVDVIGKHLPVYTEQIGLARANNRQGFPAGAAYLRQASELMRAKILPSAETLYQAETGQLAEEQSEARGFPWLTTLLVLALLVALIAAQLYLKRRTNRLFNVGLVVATVAIVLGVLWSSVALIANSVLIGSSESDGTAQVDLLVQARIAGLKARADETLTLVARGEGPQYEEEFVAMSGTMAGKDGRGGLLGQARAAAEDDAAARQLEQAQKSASAWLKAHTKVRKLDTDGEYAEAVKLAIDEKRKDGTAKAFMQVDDDLRTAITQGRQIFFDDASNASTALTLLPWGWLILGVIAALGVGAGIHERLREYR